TVLQPGQPNIAPIMLVALLWATLAFTILYAYLLALRMRVGRLETKAMSAAFLPLPREVGGVPGAAGGGGPGSALEPSQIEAHAAGVEAVHGYPRVHRRRLPDPRDLAGRLRIPPVREGPASQPARRRSVCESMNLRLPRLRTPKLRVLLLA